MCGIIGHVYKDSTRGRQPPAWEWLSEIIDTHCGVLHTGELVTQDIIDSGKVNDVHKKMPIQGWSYLFFAYKLMLLEMWFRKVVEV